MIPVDVCIISDTYESFGLCDLLLIVSVRFNRMTPVLQPKLSDLCSISAMNRMRIVIASIIGLILCCFSLGSAQLSTIPLRLGGLPHVYPPIPLFDCSLLHDDCEKCTNQANCMFCWGGIATDPSLGTQSLTGLCTQLGDPKATEQCPDNNKFYLSAVCSSVVANPGCAYDYLTNTCQIIYPFNPSSTHPSYLNFSQIWFGCMIGFTVLGVTIIWSGNKWQPRAGRWEGPANEDMDVYSWLLSVLCFSLQVSALVVNAWSTTIQFPPLDGHLNYGLFGSFGSLASAPTFYSCDSRYVHPDASQTTCKVLAAGSILTFILEVIPCTIWMFTCILRFAAEKWFPANKEFWWRMECTACLLCCVGLSVWIGVCHQIIKESMLAPLNGGPYAPLDLWHSWRLNCCTAAVSIIVTIMVAINVNRSSENLVHRFGDRCCRTNRILPQNSIDLEKSPVEIELAAAATEGPQPAVNAEDASRVFAEQQAREAEEAIAGLRQAQQEKEIREAREGIISSEEENAVFAEEASSDLPTKAAPDLPDPNFVPPDQTMLESPPPYSPQQNYSSVAGSSSIVAPTVVLHTPNNFYSPNPQ